MIRPNKQHVLRLSALAVAAAAIVAPVAWSGGRAPVANRAPMLKTAAAQEQLNDRFIVTYRAGAKAAAASAQSRFATASTTLGMNIRGLRTLSTGSDVIRVDRALDKAQSK